MSMKERKERHRKIRTIMTAKGIVGAEIARQLGVTRQHVTLVISGRGCSRRVVEALVHAGIPRRLFGEEYQDDGDLSDSAGMA